MKQNEDQLFSWGLVQQANSLPPECLSRLGGNYSHSLLDKPRIAKFY
jgi:hypothetical protein